MEIVVRVSTCNSRTTTKQIFENTNVFLLGWGVEPAQIFMGVKEKFFANIH